MGTKIILGTCAGVIAVGVGDQRFARRADWVYVKIPCRAVNAFAGWLEQTARIDEIPQNVKDAESSMDSYS